MDLRYFYESNSSSRRKVRKSIKNELGVEERARLAKCLPYRQEDLSLTSRAHVKALHSWHVLGILALRMWRQTDPEAR